ncbi:hypothetical protein EWM64_g10565 [Hericium alpestre]|uniref:NECAP PHear domain-containing protein n=1 Tax=Hericium alpestre TaxID=135208 RepID=A0A4Y9ZF92_9AGAM|nr:hypothetical protein EWM64_g10565 [Hericium alpestre]
MDEFANDEIESILYIAREISGKLYKIPPLKANEGHRAQDWGALDEPIWKGRLRIVEKADAVTMRFEDVSTGTRTPAASRSVLSDLQANVRRYFLSARGVLRPVLLVFANAPYDPLKPCVDSVLDSSRYFVVRVEDKGRKAYIGMGFAERTDSFDFNVALQDYTKRFKARLNPPSPTAEDSLSPHVPAGPKKDYSLKEGQTFSISIPGRNKTETTSAGGLLGGDLLGSGATKTAAAGGGGGGFPLLPPPPSAPKRR